MKTSFQNYPRAVFPRAQVLFALAALLTAFSPAFPQLFAQDSGQPSGQPARAVRLSYVDGKVTLSQQNQVITGQAVANTPLLEGMSLATADDGRAEIQFEDGSVARIAPDSSLTLAVLRGSGSNGNAQLDVSKGLAYFELQDTGQAGPISVQFDDSVVTGSGFTILRVKDDTPPGEVAVLSGNAHLVGGSGLAVEIHGGENLTLSASDPNAYNLTETIPPDSWDQWNSDRDQVLNSELSNQSNVPASVAPDQSSSPAWGDLNANGTWYNVPDQGYVWSPYDAAGADFDPYGNGDWVYTPGFGYTWASAYPWGYLPYSCGAWNFYSGFGWGWAPGLGGCMPWWGMGFYGGANIGFAPGWYHRVPRPIGPNGPFPGRPAPMIAVNRRPMVLNAGLPLRGADTPVNINGHDVTAIRSAPARSTYENAMFGNRNGGSGAVTASTPPLSSDRQSYVASRPSYAPSVQDNIGVRDYAPSRTYTYSPSNRGNSPSVRSSASSSRSSSGQSHGFSNSFHGGGDGGGGGRSSGGGGSGGRH